MDILVVGAGIGGLSAAVALATHGHRISVYERADRISEIGAGLQITPNASKILREWGVTDLLPDFWSSTPSFKIRRWKTGEVVGRMATEQHVNLFGAPYVQVHRADLQSALLRVTENLGVRVHTGSNVVDYDLERAAIVLEDGTRVEADLVVAADGVRSIGRTKLGGPEDLNTVTTGLVVVRATIAVDDLNQLPNIIKLFEKPGLNLWVGPGRHVVAYTMRGGRLVNLVFEFPQDEHLSQEAGCDHVYDLRRVFEGWDPKLLTMIGMIKTTMKWPLLFSAQLQNWYSSSGCLVLLGDAAHVVPSFLAQGAAMAIEDAAKLAKLLPNPFTSARSLSGSLKLYEQSRIQRKARVQELSLRNLQLYHLQDGPAQAQRDSMASSVEYAAPIWKSPQDQAWLYGYTSD